MHNVLRNAAIIKASPCAQCPEVGILGFLQVLIFEYKVCGKTFKFTRDKFTVLLYPPMTTEKMSVVVNKNDR